MSANDELNIATASFLREARRRDPARYQEVARRHPVLSTWQIERRLRRERPLDASGEGEHVSHVDEAAYQDWQAAVSKDWPASS